MLTPIMKCSTQLKNLSQLSHPQKLIYRVWKCWNSFPTGWGDFPGLCHSLWLCYHRVLLASPKTRFFNLSELEPKIPVGVTVYANESRTPMCWILRFCSPWGEQRTSHIQEANVSCCSFRIAFHRFQLCTSWEPQAGSCRRWDQVQPIMHVLMSLLRGRNHSSDMAASQGPSSFTSKHLHTENCPKWVCITFLCLPKSKYP